MTPNVEEKIQAAKEQNLVQLDLSDYGLTEIPPAVFELTQLQTLILGKNYQPNDDQINRNRITYLPFEIAKLKNLQGIGLAFNDLEEFPLFIAELPKLHTIMLNNNKIQSLPPELSKLSRLRILGLDHNQLQRLPAEIGVLRQLQVLGLAHNQLSALPPAFVGLQQLQQLGLAHNNFTAFPEEILKLRALMVVGLSNNKINKLPENITQLVRLQKLDLAGNPLPNQTIDTASKGFRALQAWYYEQANRRVRRINQIIRGKRQATERVDLRERVLKMLKTKKLVCEVCNGNKKINGYSTQLKTHFNNDVCYGCDGSGVPNETVDDIHRIIESCHQQKEKYRDALISQVEEVNRFKQKMSGKTSNPSLIFEETRQNIVQIIKDKEKRVDEYIERFSVFELFETKMHILLYNHYLLKITKKEKDEEMMFSRIDKYGEFYSIANMAEVIIGEIEVLFDGLDTAYDLEDEQGLRERLMELITEFESLGTTNSL